MIKQLKQLLIPIAVLVILSFFLFLFNQISTLYIAADRLHPVVGWIVLGVSVTVFLALIIIPFVQFQKLPRAIRQPSNEEEVAAYQKKLLGRLRSNKLLKDPENQLSPTEAESFISQSKQLEHAMGVLDREADKIIQQTARMIFLTTAVSQNGKLDAITVFTAQMRMVWKVAHVYYQRPGLREMIKLYGFVGGSSLLANEIEDLDISRQIEPVAAAMFKNASGRSIPLIGPAATLIMDALLEGSTNAFLSLRVGILTKKYCGNVAVFDAKKAKKASIKEAASQLRVVTVQASGNVISQMVSATKQAGIHTLKSGWEGVKNTGKKVTDTLGAALPKKKVKATSD
jgi:hypothetical protein